MIYAAIGTDGAREVVWGLGGSAADAESNAGIEAAQSECDPGLTRTVTVSSEIASRISGGEVSAAELGI